MPSTLRRRERGTPVVGTTVAPANNPSTNIVFPWRFRLGEWVHVRGNKWHRQTVQVVGGVLQHGFPHCDVLTITGERWRIPQIHLASEAITER